MKQTANVHHLAAFRRCVIASVLFAPLAARSAFAGSAAPLHDRIDQFITAAAGGPVSPPASDAEFLRRVSLDLSGTIPSASAVRQFLADPSPDKRSALIDRLLASPDYSSRMADAFDVMLLERRTREDAAADAWRAYLQAAFAANKPWDQLSREILCPRAEDPAIRAAALFYTRRLEKVGQNPVDYPGLTRDVGRLFLGVDLKCAQCHNHKYIKQYKQADFQGLFAYVGQTFIREDVKFPAVGEQPLLKKIEFVSVFTNEKRQTGPRLPFGAETDVPAFEKGQEWATPPDAKTKAPGIPKFSTLPLLAEQVARPDNELFRRNIVNRLWFLLMGRGLVQPLDMAHADNPPSHPELLAMLADEFAAMHFDIKAFLRELALSQTYQRSSIVPDGGESSPPDRYRTAIAKRVSAEQLARSLLTATERWQAMATVADAKPAAAPADPAADANVADEKKPAPIGPLSAKDVSRRFRSAFAGPLGEPEGEFAPSVAAALFMSNNNLVLDSVKSRPGSLVERLSRIADANAMADELYLAVLTRMPTDEERADVSQFLKTRAGAREAAIGEVAWSLLASTEFCVNH